MAIKNLTSLKLKPRDIVSFGNFRLVLQHHYESHAGDDLRFLLQLERVGPCQDYPRELLWVTIGYKIIMQPGKTTKWTSLVLSGLCYVHISQAHWTSSVHHGIDPQVLEV